MSSEMKIYNKKQKRSSFYFKNLLNRDIFLKKILTPAVFFGLIIFLTTGAVTFAAITISDSSITGDASFSSITTATSTAIDIGAGNTLSLQTTNNGPITTGSGLFTIGGNISLGTNNITMTGSLGTTGARLTKGWFSDLQVTNPISASITGTASTAYYIGGGLGGSIPYQTASGTTAMLANGTNGQVLTSSGGTSAPTWTSLSAGGYGACVLSAASGSVTATDTGNCSIFTKTWTGNVTSLALSGFVTGKTYLFQLTQDATGGRTVSGATSIVSLPSQNTTAGTINSFYCTYDGSNCNVVSATNNGGLNMVPYGTTIPGTPSSGIYITHDPTQKRTIETNDSGTTFGYVEDSASDNGNPLDQIINGVPAKGKVKLTQPATSATITVADGKTLTVSNSITFAGTDGTTITFPSTSATVARTDAANTFTGIQTIPSLTLSGITGSTQCLHVNSSGVVSGTASDCGSGGSGISSYDAFTHPYSASSATTSIFYFNGFSSNASSTIAGLFSSNYASSTVYASFVNASSTSHSIGTLTLPNISGTQCLHEVSGVVSGTGADCGAGGGGVTTFNSRSGSVVPASGDYTAAQVTNAVDKTASNTYTTGAQDFTSATSVTLPVSGSYAPTSNGSIGYDSTQLKPVIGDNSTTVSIPRVLCLVGSPGGNGAANNMASSDGGTYNTLTSNAAQSSAYTFNTTCTIPANTLIANKRLRVTATFLDTRSASTPTTVYDLKLGSTIVSQGTATNGASSITNHLSAIMWYVDGTAAASASAPVEASVISGAGGAESVGSLANTLVPSSIPSVATNGSLTVGASVQFGTNTAGNMSQLRSLMVEILN